MSAEPLARLSLDVCQDLGSAEQSLIEVLETSPSGVVILDSNGRVMFWNSRLIDMLGGLQGEAFAEAAGQMFFKDWLVRRRALAEFDATGVVRGLEIELITADGRDAWASVTMQRITFEGRRAALVWFYDLSDRIAVEKDLEASEDALLSVLEASPIGATILDRNGRVLFWNSRLLDILGVQGADFSDAAGLVLDGDATLRDGLLHQLDDTGQVRDASVTLRRGDGTPINALVSMERVVFERQNGVLTWIYDVSDLRRAQVSAEAAARAKSAFLATVSHEIRTPMNGVVTMADLLADTGLSTDQRQMVNTIRDSGRSLLTIINDILDFSKIEAGRIEVEVLPTDLINVIEGSAALMAPKAHEKGLQFRTMIAEGVPQHVLSDGVRVRQVLLNLIGNAIKFTHHGHIELKLEPGPLGVRFTVCDTGIGMAPDQLSRLFSAFSQAEASTARRFGGSGLGLSISKGLVEAMGGRIEVDSRLGGGSRFIVDLPAVPCPAPQRSAEGGESEGGAHRWRPPVDSDARAAGVMILCAEDNPTNRTVLHRVLDRLGFAHELVVDGVKALEALQARRDDYGLLITDCHMPGLDGWELTHTIRAIEAAGGSPRLPVLALTADAVKGTADQCEAAGMDGYLTKPLNLDALEAAVLAALPDLAELRTPLEEEVSAASTTQLVSVDAQVLDLTPIVELVGNDVDARRDILTGFLEAATPLVEEVVTYTDGPVKGPQDAAHGLKSAAAYVGAAQLSSIAAAIEQSFRENRIADAKGLARALKPALDGVARAIEAVLFEQELVHMRAEISTMAQAGDKESSGMLASVVGMTEQAASRILEAAEVIAGRIEAVGDSEEARVIQDQLTAIFEACSFQDLTSQRLRRAIAKLAQMEERLDGIVRTMDKPTTPTPNSSIPAADDPQAAIDALFA
ncbi:MAG: ATP-binding protein [Alphaproteobacteria bacterium]|nr:ATP-binding protein [Alphaproteobacteria bacterium]